MSVVTLILIFLLAVIASVFISRLLGTKFPLPFIQISPLAQGYHSSVLMWRLSRICSCSFYPASAVSGWLADPERSAVQ